MRRNRSFVEAEQSGGVICDFLANRFQRRCDHRRTDVFIHLWDLQTRDLAPPPGHRQTAWFRPQATARPPAVRSRGIVIWVMIRSSVICAASCEPQASPHFFRRDFNKLEIGQSVGRSIVVAPRGWPSFSFPWFRAGGNERRVNIRLLQMLMVHVGVKNEGIREPVSGWERTQATLSEGYASLWVILRWEPS